MFGQAATKYIELRHFGSEQSDYLSAVSFAKEICEYTGLSHLDESKIKKSLWLASQPMSFWDTIIF